MAGNSQREKGRGGDDEEGKGEGFFLFCFFLREQRSDWKDKAKRLASALMGSMNTRFTSTIEDRYEVPAWLRALKIC